MRDDVRIQNPFHPSIVNEVGLCVLPIGGWILIQGANGWILLHELIAISFHL